MFHRTPCDWLKKNRVDLDAVFQWSQWFLIVKVVVEETEERGVIKAVATDCRGQDWDLPLVQD